MKLYIDDERPTPEGWVTAQNYWEAVELLKTGLVTHVSFDHDLGSAEPNNERTGYDVICWLEEEIHNNQNFKIPVMDCHSDNGPGRQRIEGAINAIIRRQQQ